MKVARPVREGAMGNPEQRVLVAYFTQFRALEAMVADKARVATKRAIAGRKPKLLHNMPEGRPPEREALQGP